MTIPDNQTSQTTLDRNKNFQTKSQFLLGEISFKLLSGIIFPSFSD